MPPGEVCVHERNFHVYLSKHIPDLNEPSAEVHSRDSFTTETLSKDLSLQKWKIYHIKINCKRIPIQYRRNWAAAENEILVADYRLQLGSFSEFELCLLCS